VFSSEVRSLVQSAWVTTVVLEDDQIHGSVPPGSPGRLHRRRRTQLAEFGFTLWDASRLQRIDKFEQLPLPAYELGPGLTTAAIVLGHRSQRFELLGWGRDVPRPSLAAVGKDGAFVELAAAAVAVGLAAFSPQGVERAWEKWFASEPRFQKLRELVLGRQKLGAERAELLVHEWGPPGYL
jgi:hypothetical protein